MAVPAVPALDVQHHPLPGPEIHRVTERSQRDLDRAVGEAPDRVDLVVVQNLEVAGEKLAVQVEREPDSPDHDITPAEHWRPLERSRIEQPVHEADSDEHPRCAMKRPPEFIAEHAAQQLAEVAVTHSPDRTMQPHRAYRSPARRDRPAR
jgi:hypothetical protein